MAEEEYTAKDIRVLDGIEAVRARPAMYIGDVSVRGFHHLLFEVVDNSIDEAMAGACDRVDVVLYTDGRAEVTDNGRGIPVDVHEETGKSALEVVLTMLHAGGKFDRKVYRISGGLHGVGVSVVNALSQFLVATVWRDGRTYQMRFEYGRPVSGLEVLEDTDRRGTKIEFLPDKEIFEKVQWDVDIVQERLEELAYLNPGLKITLSFPEKGYYREFLFEGGLKEYVLKLAEGKELLFEPPFYFEQIVEDVRFQGALIYVRSTEEQVITFANNIRTVEGGTHLEGMRAAWTNVIKNYEKNSGSSRDKDLQLTGEDVREGAIAVLSVNLPEPQFEGQTKTKLGNSFIKGLTQQVFGARFGQFLEENPTAARAIIQQVTTAARARIAARKAAEAARKQSFATLLPGKLVDCISKNPEETEIFIVEGQSAAGNSKKARDARFQAILPLKGKILNVEKASLEKILHSEEIKALALSLGIHFGNSGYDPSRLRYHRIILLTDADVDGAHLRALLLTFFYRYAQEIILNGHLYIAQPPLYRIKKGNKSRYVLTEEEKMKVLQEWGENCVIVRFKGLGEMEDKDLWETAMNPESRKLVQVTIKDAQEAEKLLSILMGKDVEPRRKYLQEHAPLVSDLDI
ncbi:MAG: DNA gyrase/topoisomerase IV subunit B [bacterium JZ-2024 1]